jgi:hypothetical protein
VGAVTSAPPVTCNCHGWPPAYGSTTVIDWPTPTQTVRPLSVALRRTVPPARAGDAAGGQVVAGAVAVGIPPPPEGDDGEGLDAAPAPPVAVVGPAVAVVGVEPVVVGLAPMGVGVEPAPAAPPDVLPAAPHPPTANAPRATAMAPAFRDQGRGRMHLGRGRWFKGSLGRRSAPRRVGWAP